jgi:hypothetical protein
MFSPILLLGGSSRAATHFSGNKQTQMSINLNPEWFLFDEMLFFGEPSVLASPIGACVRRFFPWMIHRLVDSVIGVYFDWRHFCAEMMFLVFSWVASAMLLRGIDSDRRHNIRLPTME